jgi:hypothetical protein
MKKYHWMQAARPLLELLQQGVWLLLFRLLRALFFFDFDFRDGFLRQAQILIANFATSCMKDFYSDIRSGNVPFNIAIDRFFTKIVVFAELGDRNPFKI